MHTTQKQYVPINIIDSAFEKLNINDARLVAAKKRYGTTLPIEYTTSITDTLKNGDVIQYVEIKDEYGREVYVYYVHAIFVSNLLTEIN